tara:strand:- start:199 stop:876 length:678 start_codon:yes stop_codon:yes gene_type:complete
MKEHDFSKESFIGGWYMPEEVCNDLISFFIDCRVRVSHVSDEILEKDGDVKIDNGLILRKGNIGKDSKINKDTKDSVDLSIEFGANNYKHKPITEYGKHLHQCLNNYEQKYEYVKGMDRYTITENMNIQHYKAGGGFKKWHFENTSIESMSRKLVFMTYLNNVENGGTEFYYQGIKCPAKKGLTLIWPADWTHTHRGIIDESNEKMIITGWFSYEDNRTDWNKNE